MHCWRQKTLFEFVVVLWWLRNRSLQANFMLMSLHDGGIWNLIGSKVRADSIEQKMKPPLEKTVCMNTKALKAPFFDILIFYSSVRIS